MDSLAITPLEDRASFGYRVAGDLDLLTIPDLEAVLVGADGHRPLVLDMSGVRFMDSTGLRLILRLCSQTGGEPNLIIRNPSRQVWRLLDLCVPNGAPGVEFQFDGTGPGAARRLSLLTESSLTTRAESRRVCDRAARCLGRTRRLRAENSFLRAERCFA
jgi:anti-anti-sigma factor